MAHTTKCAAPEGNRGRDEWMTVIEMQEYMGRVKARCTTSSDRERSTRTGSAGNDGRDRPENRPRPGTRGSLETKGARGRP